LEDGKLKEREGGGGGAEKETTEGYYMRPLKSIRNESFLEKALLFFLGGVD